MTHYPKEQVEARHCPKHPRYVTKPFCPDCQRELEMERANLTPQPAVSGDVVEWVDEQKERMNFQNWYSSQPLATRKHADYTSWLARATLPPVQPIGEDEAVEVMARAINAYEQESYHLDSGRLHPNEKPGDTGFMADARSAYRALLSLLAHSKPAGSEKLKYNCTACQDTGKIYWTDYSNGQGLDIDRVDDCDQCPTTPLAGSKDGGK